MWTPCSSYCPFRSCPRRSRPRSALANMCSQRSRRPRRSRLPPRCCGCSTPYPRPRRSGSCLRTGRTSRPFGGFASDSTSTRSAACFAPTAPITSRCRSRRAKAKARARARLRAKARLEAALTCPRAGAPTGVSSRVKEAGCSMLACTGLAPFECCWASRLHAPPLWEVWASRVHAPTR